MSSKIDVGAHAAGPPMRGAHFQCGTCALKERTSRLISVYDHQIVQLERLIHQHPGAIDCNRSTAQCQP